MLSSKTFTTLKYTATPTDFVFDQPLNDVIEKNISDKYRYKHFPFFDI